VIVVDSNVMAARNLTSVHTPWAELVEKQDAVWVVPPLWRYEFQNILAKALWARQLALGDALEAWSRTVGQIADNEQEPSPERVIELSHHHRITSYDATFIALAMELTVPCVTEDRELQEKFPAIAVCMRAFVGRPPGAGEAREAPAPYRARRRRK
jgi:predicted nucleic acid-binding protein